MKSLNKTEQTVSGYLAFMPSPATIDALIQLTGISAVDLLNAMETLKTKNLVHEKKSTGKGVYFFDHRILNHLPANLHAKEKKEIVEKLIRHFSCSLDESSEKTIIMADLYMNLRETAEGLGFLIAAADILYRSENRPKAIGYYAKILDYFEHHAPVRENIRTYLEAVLGYISISFDLITVEEKVSILTKAEKIAEHHRQWRHLAIIKFHLSREFIVSGQSEKASRTMNDFISLASELEDPEIQRMVALAKSEMFYFQGKIRKATEVYDNAIGNLEQFGDEEITLRMSALVGWFYVISGRIARGMGLINTVREKSRLFGFRKTAIFADLMKIHGYFEIRKTKEAEAVLSQITGNLDDATDYFTLWAINRCNSFVQYAQKNYREAFAAYEKGNEYIKLLGWPLKLNGWCVELLFTLQSQEPFKGKIDIDSEIERLTGENDIYTKGFALRFRAIRNQEKDRPRSAVAADLKESEKYLKLAGAEIELARTRMALGEYYQRNGDRKQAQANFNKAKRFFSNVDKNLWPEDLMMMMPQEEKTTFMMNRIVEIAESLGTIHEISLFLERALDIVMDFTLAMRGAIFFVESGRPKIIASRNVDLQLSDGEYFGAIKEAILAVERRKSGMIFPGSSESDGSSEKKLKKAGLKTFVCLPVALGKKNYAYLFLDNRFGDAAFPEDSLPFLKVLCTQLAVGLSNLEMYNEMKELKERFESEAVFYRQEIAGSDNPTESIIGESEETKKVLDQIGHVAPMDSSVLILGETGVGKELIARTIHNLSRRKDGPFISVNLSVIPNELFASELFGHEKGAFTGAGERRRGRFELADGGTIFLDEIGDLPAVIQVKLLRVLEEGSFERLGGMKPIKSDFRVLAATNKNLISEVEQGRFRQDLYFRLNAFPVHISPLRERKEDIPALTEHFAQMFRLKTKKRHRRISKRELKKLLNYHWPGNVRELKHFIERAIILSDGKTLRFPAFEDPISNRSTEETERLLPLSDVERSHITKVLNATGWRVNGKEGAADILEMKPSTVFFRMKKLGIKRPSPAKPEAVS